MDLTAKTRPAGGKLHYMHTAPGQYVIEWRRGTTSACIGRVQRSGPRCWAALGVNARSWTDFVPTRTEAVERMQQDRVYRQV